MSLDSPRLAVTILGSGTCVPSLTRSACSILVEMGADKILLDLGPGTMRRLLERQVTVFDISHILISHFHPDHTGELATFLFANKYPDSSRRQKPLTIAGGPGFPDFFSRLENVYGDWIRLEPGLLHLQDLSGDAQQPITIGAAGLAVAPMAHRPESLGFRLNFPQGRSLVYSGDTDYTENLISLAKGADILICECAVPDEKKIPGHLTPGQAGEIAARAVVGTLVLTHFYPECDQADIVAQCRRTYNGPLIVAEDLLLIPFPQGRAGVAAKQ